MRWLFLIGLLLALVEILRPYSDSGSPRVKRLYHEITALHTRVTLQRWLSEVHGEGIIVGATPLEEMNHTITLCNALNITVIVGVVEEHELQPTVCCTPVHSLVCQWTVTKFLIWAAPSEPLVEELLTVGKTIGSMIKRGERVFVFSTSGTRRAPAAVIAYLVLKRGMTYTEAYELVKRSHPPTWISGKQREHLQSLQPLPIN